ncbi:heterokaryon incompatibility domain-containing protein, partial [Trichoderma sp. TUCIM 5745]
MDNNYEYDKIDVDGPAFRLVRLHQGESGDLSCDLFQAVLHQDDEIIPYEALSYTWGPIAGRHSIVVNDQKMSITANLYLALKSLRYPHSDRILWIDAVCINQSNVKERNHQVAQMSDIYKQASRVIFFLGNATFTTDAFMHFMQLFQQECSKYAYRSWTRDDERWKKIRAVAQEKTQAFDDVPCQGLRSLLSRPWFRRVWILQEVASAKSAIVCCGNLAVAANIFAIAPIIFGVKPSVHCQSVIDIMPGPWRQTSWWREKPSLYTLLLRFGETEASEPRDLIYALTAIAAESDSPILTPDYNKTESRLVCDVVGFLFNFTCNDDLLSGVCTTIKDTIKNLERVKDHLLWKAAKAADIERLDGIFRAPGIKIPEDTIGLVAEYDMNGEMMNLLLNSRNKESEETVANFLLAVETGTVPAIKGLEHHISSQTTFPSLEEKLLAAAWNKHHGSSLVEYFLSNGPTLDDYTRIAEAAAANKEHAVNIMQQLLRRGCHITMTHQLHSNALTSGCYKDVLELFIKGPWSEDCTPENSAVNNASEESSNAESARAFFRSQAKFLLHHAIFDYQLFAIFKLSGQQLESHGYIFLEEFFLCAAEVFAESKATLSSKQREQFNSAVGTMSWVIEDSGFQIRITHDALQTAINGNFESEIFRLLTKARQFVIDFGAALRVVKLGNILSVEKILLYQEGLFRRNTAILDAFQDWYIHNDVYIHKGKRQKHNWLNQAVNCECYQVTQLLLSFGADTERKDIDGQTALAATESCRFAALLLSYGANIDARGSCRRTPVHWAVSRKNYGLVELLLVCGADINTTDSFGETPLDRAAQLGILLPKMLRKYGANKMATSPSSERVKTLLQEAPLRAPVSISATVQGLMEEFGLVAKPNGWSLGDDCKHLGLPPRERHASRKRRVDDV